jgi:hypothetical protein
MRYLREVIQSIAAPALFLAAASAQAALVFEPLTDLGLSPGDTYRYAFVTSTTRDASSSNIDDYNTFVQDAADGLGSRFVGSGITWKAIGSGSIDASDNIGGSFTHAVYRLDGARIAMSSTDLWSGTIENSLSITELDTFVTDSVWTGTQATGTGSSARLGSGPFITYGSSGATSDGWINGGNAHSSNNYHIYAISEELQVPAAAAPVPPTTALLGLGLVAAAMSRRRLRR